MQRVADWQAEAVACAPAFGGGGDAVLATRRGRDGRWGRKRVVWRGLTTTRVCTHLQTKQRNARVVVVRHRLRAQHAGWALLVIAILLRGLLSLLVV